MVPYEFYLAAYRGGSISAQDWPAAEREACAVLTRYKRMYTVTAPADIVDAESMACLLYTSCRYALEQIWKRRGQ